LVTSYTWPSVIIICRTFYAILYNLTVVQDCLNRKVLADMRSNKESIEEAVLAVEMVKKESELT